MQQLKLSQCLLCLTRPVLPVQLGLPCLLLLLAWRRAKVDWSQKGPASALQAYCQRASLLHLWEELLPKAWLLLGG